MPKGSKGKASDPIKDAIAAQQITAELRLEIQTKEALERKNATLNTFKLNQKYIATFKKEKTEQLKQESQSLSHSNINSLSTKNSIITRLETDMIDSELQFSTAIQAHLVHINSLANLQDSRCHSLLNDFDFEKIFLEQALNFERASILGAHMKNKKDVYGVLIRLGKEYDEAESEMKHEWTSAKDDIKSKHLEEKHALRIQLEGTIEDLWRHFQSALDQYTNNTEDKRIQFLDLKTKDSKNAKDIDLQMKKLVQIQDHIMTLKAKLSQKSIIHSTSSSQLNHRKLLLSHSFRSLKKTCTVFQSKQHTLITEMLSASQKSIKILDKKKEMADKIMTLHLLIKKVGHHGFLQDATLNDMKLSTYLDVQMEKNRNLKAALNEYMNGWNVNANIMDGPNSLLMINSKPLESVRSKKEYITMIDGPAIMKLYNAQGF